MNTYTHTCIRIHTYIHEPIHLYSAAHVAKGIVRYAGEGYFGIGVGMEGFMLKHLHAGMSPVNNFTEVQAWW